MERFIDCLIKELVVQKRCTWVGDNPLFIDYHDNEYGIKVTDANTIFERLILEIFQAGLNWDLILKKRKALNDAFHNFELLKVAQMKDKELEKLRDNKSIIRNKLKINATRNNARVFLDIINRHGSIINYLHSLPYEVKNDPNKELKETVKIMKKDGFKFIGTMVLHEFFLSIGLNEVKHEERCFKSK